MLYLVSKVYATEWFVNGRTTLHTSHCNGSTKPHVAKWPKIKPMGNLNGYPAITT